MDAGARNPDVWRCIADLYNDQATFLPHPDDKCEWCKFLDPNSCETFKNTRSGEVLARKWSEIKGVYSRVRCVSRASLALVSHVDTDAQVHRNFTSDDSGHHDMEVRRFPNYIVHLGAKQAKLCVYIHHLFYDTPLIDFATKLMPGGGADGNGGDILLQPRRSKASKDKDVLIDMVDSMRDDETQEKIGTALEAVGNAAMVNCKIKQQELDMAKEKLATDKENEARARARARCVASQFPSYHRRGTRSASRSRTTGR